MLRHAGPFLQINRLAVASSWLNKVRAELPPERAVTMVQTVDSMLVFLDQMSRDLGADQPRCETNDVAREHGRQRHGLGTGLPDLVREYGLCFAAISELLDERGESLSTAAQRSMAGYLSTAAAVAVDEYAARDVERQRQADFESFAFVAHELRGPLSTLRLALEMVQRELPHATAAILQRAIHRAATLLDSSITRARVTPTGSLRLERLAVRELIQDAVDEVDFKAQQRGVRLAVEVDDALSVDGDRRLLHSVFVNLVGNGAKFSRLGSVVGVRGAIVEGRLVLEVQDQCGGLRSADVAAMFAAFQQTGDDRRAGLGLALTRQAVEAHAGTLNVVSDEGVGCRFVVDLPTP
jgi:signal transduction histidine kinase